MAGIDIHAQTQEEDTESCEGMKQWAVHDADTKQYLFRLFFCPDIQNIQVYHCTLLLFSVLHIHLS